MKSNKKQFLLFIVSGGIAAFINILSRAILSIFFDFKISIIFAYCIGMITAYILSRKFVFISNHNLTKSESINWFSPYLKNFDFLISLL